MLNFKFKFKRFAGFVAVVMSALLLTACANKTEKLLEYIDKNDFSGAYDYYDEKIDGSNKEDDIVDEFEDEMEDRYDDIIDAFYAGEVDEDNMEDLLDMLDDMRFDSDEYEDFLDNYSDALVSKNNYAEGIKYFEDGDYSLAMSYFSDVNKKDSNYNDAQAKIEEAELGMVSGYLDDIESDIESGNYYSAAYSLDYYAEQYADNDSVMTRVEELRTKISDNIVDVIQGYIDDEDFYNASYYLEYYSKEYLGDKYDELKETVDSAAVEYAKTYVDECFAEYDYDDAKWYVEELLYDFPENAELQALYDNLESVYVEYILAEAQKYADKKDYANAASVTDIAISEIGDGNTDLNNAYNEYKAYLPVYINDLDYLACNGSISSDSSYDIKDNTNIEHRHSYCIDGWSKEEYWAEYLLNGNYNTFSGVCGVSYDQRSATDTKYFEIYADGVLIYTSPTMTQSVLPVEFSVDVTGVNVIKIMYPATDGDNNIATIYDGLFTRNDDTDTETASGDESSAESTSTAE